MKSKRKLLSVLMGFILIVMVGYGISKSNAFKKSASQNVNNVSKAQKQFKGEDKTNKKQDSSLDKKDLKENGSSKDSETFKENNSSKNSNTSKNKSHNNSNINVSKYSTSNNKSSVTKPSQKDNSTVNTSKNKTFTIIISQEEKGYMGKDSRRITTKELLVENNKNAMIYLKENFAAKDKGGLIVEVSGIHNVYPLRDKTKEQRKLGVLGIDWFIYLNDKKTPVGANDVYPKEGDILQLDIHQWDKRELKI